MTDKIDFTPDYGAKENSSIIKVIGVGGGGSNAVKHMYSEGIVGVDFLICNTDQGHLEKCPIPDKLQLGPGLGAGAKPEIARQFAIESKEKIQEFIGKETKMLFITAGMGKGTGTGASPVIAEVAHEMGILTIGVVTYPFRFEGKNRQKLADQGIEELSKYVDSLIVVKNQNILTYYKDQNMLKAYGYADDVLKNAVKCIAELITIDYGQNVDFNDVQTSMKDSGKAMLGIATANGEDRVERVVDDALNCPLLDTTIINNAKNFLFFISYGPDANFSAGELEQLTDRFEDLQSDDANIIWGQGLDESLGDSIKLSVIITNFSSAEEHKESHTLIAENNEIITTSQKIGTTIIDDTPIAQPQPAQVPNDLGSLISQDTQIVAQAPSTPVNAQPSNVYVFENDQVLQKPSAPQRPNINNMANGPQRVEEERNILYNSEDEFRHIIDTPAIHRMNETRAATMSAATATATQIMEPTSNYEMANDMSEFFVGFSD